MSKKNRTGNKTKKRDDRRVHGRRLSLFSKAVQDINSDNVADEIANLHRIRAAYDAAFDPMITINSSGQIAMANVAATKQFGYTHGELIGANVSMICGGGHSCKHDGYIRRYLETGQKRIIGTRREILARRKDGTEFPVSLGISEIESPPADESERACNSTSDDERYFCAYLRDLAEQKKHEQEILDHKALVQGMIDSSFDPIFSITEEGIITVVNQAAVSMFGYTQQEFIGRNINMICGGDHGKQHDGYIKRYLKMGEARVIGRRRQVTARRKNGSEFEVELGISEVNVGGKRVFTGFCRDLTKQLLDQQMMLDQALHMEDTFFLKNKNKIAGTRTPPTPPLTPPTTPLTPPPKESASEKSPGTPRTPKLKKTVSLGKYSATVKKDALSW